MCLCVDEQKTKKMSGYKQQGPITVWKVYEFLNGRLYSPLYGGSDHVANLVVSDRDVQEFSHDDLDIRYPDCSHYYIYRGIHVCLTREAAREYKRLLKRNQRNSAKKFVIVRCTTDLKHFVAAGHSYYTLNKCDNGAVFMKIHVSPEDHDKALNGDFR